MKRVLVILFVAIVVAAISFIVYNYLHNAPEKKITEVMYTCPMHPQIIMNSPGSCPICGMDLVPVNAIQEKSDHADHGMIQEKAPIHLTQNQEEILGITYETVGVKEIVKDIITSATIEPNEENVYKITVRVSGWVEKLYINQTGQYVAKGTPLFSLYSPELYAAMDEYVAILNTIDASLDNSIKEVILNLKHASQEKLKIFGLTQRQIDEIAKSKKAPRVIQLVSPYSGYVTEKNVYEGQKVSSDENLFTITDLTTVWAIGDIYQPDVPYITIGMPAVYRIQSWNNKEYKGHVEFIYPFVNEKSRTLKVRVVIHNNRLELKPGLYGELALRFSVGKHIAIPQQSVFRTGTQSYVFVKMKDGTLMPHEIITGILGNNGYYVVEKGLKKGDVIVSSAMFLIDSESQLKAVFNKVKDGHTH
ncbi:MAG: efflux RND transporter periplasmic adaptor subunit [Spirochaetes bacterium]|nr:efflux RND transporter periplasmic adaptor subunit [Spirochaetota bacterium]